MSSTPVPAAVGPSISVDLVLCAPNGRQLDVWLVQNAQHGSSEHWCLPSDSVTGTFSLNDAASVVATRAGVLPNWLEQVGARATARRHPGAARISIVFAGVTHQRQIGAARGARWFPEAKLPALAPPVHDAISSALTHLRTRADQFAVAAGLVGPTFSLRELQTAYELLLERTLHKASFRRALRAAELVESTGESRQEARGRPTQLYRHLPIQQARQHRRRIALLEMLGA